MEPKDAKLEAEAKRLEAIVRELRAEGRQLLVVVGAGCSAGAGMPLMSDVYRYLAEETSKRLRVSGTETNNASRTARQLESWLELLSRELGPRSIAAKALGALQQPYLLDADTRSTLAPVWERFAEAFLCWKVTAPKNLPAQAQDGSWPTLLQAVPCAFHERVGEWVRDGDAFAVSLNFDGLTRAAVRNASGNQGKCVVLTTPEQVDAHFLGEQESPGRLHAVIKVWGDVFHAVCVHEQCPEQGARVPLYDLRQAPNIPTTPVQAQRQTTAGPKDEAAVPPILTCPECGSTRQLQIFFTGYQQKDENSRDLFNAMRRWISPRIGAMVIVGVSGRWDDALLDYLAEIGKRLQKESSAERVVCIDRDERPYIIEELERRGVSARAAHCPKGADSLGRLLKEMASARTSTVDTSLPPPHSQMQSRIRPIKVTHTALAWHGVLASNGESPQYPFALDQVDVTAAAYDKRFGSLRQLGLKTRMLAGQDEGHNRASHSVGVAHIGLAWLRALRGTASSQATSAGLSPELLEAVVFLAGLFHDLGHLPFTHLAEEAFAELSWRTEDWSDGFHHDHNVLNNCHADLRTFATDTINASASRLGVNSAVLSSLIQRAIEGATGIGVIDAIVNSPIDADKIEYLFSDCHAMAKEVHLPIATEADRIGWVKTFVGDKQRVLPSGAIAIVGAAAEHARQLLEERRWLYKQLYFRPAFRVAERIARQLIVLWLTRGVADVIAKKCTPDATEGSSSFLALLNIEPLGDVRAIKGSVARTLLWSGLDEVGPRQDLPAGEPGFAIHIAERLLDEKASLASGAVEWIGACRNVLKAILDNRESMLAATPVTGLAVPERISPYALFERRLRGLATWSSRMYISQRDLPAAKEIVRDLEISTPFSGLVDLARIPPMLSYPPTRKRDIQGRRLYSDCWAVSHVDPDRWDRESGKWIPLSASAFAHRDREGWVQVMCLTPYSNDGPSVRHIEDRFRTECDKRTIAVREEDPEFNDGQLGPRSTNKN